MVNLIDLGQRKDNTHIMVNPSDSKDGLREFLNRELETDLPEETRRSVQRALSNIERGLR